MKTTVIATALLVSFFLFSVAWGFDFGLGDGLTAGDVNGDGTDEIIHGDANLNRMLIYDMDGTLVSSFNRYFTDGDGLTAGDVNGDGTDEIIHGDVNLNRMLIYDMDGTLVSSFNRDFESGDGLTAGDINGDGKDEIIFGNLDGNKIWMYTKDGHPITAKKYIKVSDFAPGEVLAAGDVNGDGKDEIIHGDVDNRIRTYNMVKQIGIFTRRFDPGDGLTAGDINGDGKDEIIHGDVGYSITAWKLDGTRVSNFKRVLANRDGLTAGDVNGDGKDEIIYASRVDDDIEIFNMSGGLDFKALDEAVPGGLVLTLAPVFDFDIDGCLPSAPINLHGLPNPGMPDVCELGATGCRRADFLDYSNTVHRHTCITEDNVQYCVHFYLLYFKKDFCNCGIVACGHRHDCEFAAIWTTDGVITAASFSAHGDVNTRECIDDECSNLPLDKDGHVKFNYGQDGSMTHCLRFAYDKDELADNPYGEFVTPPIISWYSFTGDGISNVKMRKKFSSFGTLPDDFGGDFGSAISTSKFWAKIKSGRPPSYPARLATPRAPSPHPLIPPSRLGLSQP